MTKKKNQCKFFFLVALRKIFDFFSKFQQFFFSSFTSKIEKKWLWRRKKKIQCNFFCLLALRFFQFFSFFILFYFFIVFSFFFHIHILRGTFVLWIFFLNCISYPKWQFYCTIFENEAIFHEKAINFLKISLTYPPNCAFSHSIYPNVFKNPRIGIKESKIFFWSLDVSRRETLGFTLVRSSVRHSVFSTTALWIFLIFVMKLLWDICRKVTFLFFWKKFLIPQIKGLIPKNGQKITFWPIISKRFYRICWNLLRSCNKCVRIFLNRWHVWENS